METGPRRAPVREARPKGKARLEDGFKVRGESEPELSLGAGEFGFG